MLDPSEHSPAAPNTAIDLSQTSNLQAIVATLAALHATREPLAAALDTVDKEITRVMTQAHQAMVALGARNFATAAYELELRKKVVYNATDWNALQTYIAANPINFDLIQRRLSSTAIRQRSEMPPGIMQAVFDEPHFSPIKVQR